MRLPKWLLLQMLQTRITCSKKKVFTFFFYYNTTLKWSQKCQNVAQMLPKSWSIEKEKSPKSLSDSSLGDFSSGATGKCYPLRNELASNILKRRKKVCTLHCTLTIFGAFHYFSLRLSLRKDKY